MLTQAQIKRILEEGQGLLVEYPPFGTVKLDGDEFSITITDFFHRASDCPLKDWTTCYQGREPGEHHMLDFRRIVFTIEDIYQKSPESFQQVLE